MLHLLSDFPPGYHLRNALRFGPPGSVAFWIHNTKAFPHFIVTGKTFRLMQISNAVSAPPPFFAAFHQNAFSTTGPCSLRARPDARMVFLIDHPDTIISLVQTKKIGSHHRPAVNPRRSVPSAFRSS